MISMSVFALPGCRRALVGDVLLTYQVSVLFLYIRRILGLLDCLTLKDRINMLFSNFGNKLPTNNAQNPRRVKTSTTPQQKPKISHISVPSQNIEIHRM
jgi:hypothetical protein